MNNLFIISFDVTRTAHRIKIEQSMIKTRKQRSVKPEIREKCVKARDMVNFVTELWSRSGALALEKIILPHPKTRPLFLHVSCLPWSKFRKTHDRKVGQVTCHGGFQKKNTILRLWIIPFSKKFLVFRQRTNTDVSKFFFIFKSDTEKKFNNKLSSNRYKLYTLFVSKEKLKWMLFRYVICLYSFEFLVLSLRVWIAGW